LRFVRSALSKYSPRSPPPPAGGGSITSAASAARGQLRIKAKQGGVLTTLAAKPFTVAIGRRYTFAAVVAAEDLILFVDGVQELSTSDGALTAGRIGTLAVNGDVRFDEVLVIPH
jgi:hypothetical protein